MAGRDPPDASRYTARMNRPSAYHMFRLVFVAALVATLAGCGNKGPLVLPAPSVEPVTAPEAPAEAPVETPAAEPATDGTGTPPEPTPEPTPVPATSNGGGNG